MQHAGGVDPADHGSSCQPVSGTVSMWPDSASPPGRAAMRDQHALRHAGGVGIIEPLDLETGERGLDPLRHRQVGDEAAAVEGDEVAGQVGEQVHKGGFLAAVGTQTSGKNRTHGGAEPVSVPVGRIRRFRAALSSDPLAHIYRRPAHERLVPVDVVADRPIKGNIGLEGRVREQANFRTTSPGSPAFSMVQ